MISLKISNSYTQLVNASQTEVDLAKTVLSYHDAEIGKQIRNLFMQIKFASRNGQGSKVVFFKKKIGELKPQEHVCLLDSNGSFPSGLVFLVEDIFKENKIEYKLVDLREKPKKYINYPWYSELKLRYYQKEALDAALKAGRGVIESCVGSGKSALLAELIRNLGVKSLVIVPAKDLKYQLMESFIDSFGSNQIGEITSSSVKSNKKNGLLENVLSSIDFVCYDECHHMAASTFFEMLPYFEHIFYRFGTSGTFIRGDSKTLPLWGFISEVVYRYPASKATKEGFLTPLKVIIHEIEGKSNKKYQLEYNLNYTKNPELLIKIKEIFETYITKKDQVLILVRQKDASGKVIHEFLNELGVTNSFVSGDSKREDIKKAISEFNEEKIKVLIGSAVLGEGIDIRSTTHLLYLIGGKSQTQLTQGLGRCVRLHKGKKIAYVHDILFSGTRYLEGHCADRVHTYEQNFEPESIEVV